MRVDLIRLISILLCLVPERMQVRLETGFNNHLKTVDLYKQSLIESIAGCTHAMKFHQSSAVMRGIDFK